MSLQQGQNAGQGQRSGRLTAATDEFRQRGNGGLTIDAKTAAEIAPERDTTLHAGLAANRTAYLGGFHAAQAFISEKTGRLVKMHKDVHAEMYRLSKADSNLDPDLRISLAQAYNLKAVADYETGPGAEISPERARDATRSARHFVAYFEKLLRTPGSEMSK